MYKDPKTLKYLIILLLAPLAVLSQEPAPGKKAANPVVAMAAPKEVDTALPNVLLIGDSISIGYTVGVRQALEKKANVYRPPTNCGPTSNGVKSLEKWLGDQKWSVIHFNFGLHDLKYVGEKGDAIVDPKSPNAHQMISKSDYEKNLRALVATLQKTGAKLIWCSTTPVPEGARGRIPGDEVAYNEVAAKIMTEHKIQINDLYATAKAKLTEIQRPKDVHYTDSGSKFLAAAVASVVEKNLSK